MDTGHETVCIQLLPYHMPPRFRPSDGRSAPHPTKGPRDNLPDSTVSLNRPGHSSDGAPPRMVATHKSRLSSRHHARALARGVATSGQLGGSPSELAVVTRNLSRRGIAVPLRAWTLPTPRLARIAEPRHLGELVE